MLPTKKIKSDKDSEFLPHKAYVNNKTDLLSETIKYVNFLNSNRQTVELRSDLKSKIENRMDIEETNNPNEIKSIFKQDFGRINNITKNL